VLAGRALSHALAAGDRALAVTAARSLQKAGELAPDARLLLLTEALRERDWRGAEAHVVAIEKDEIFAFMAPILRAWLAQGSKRGDPLALLAGGDHSLTTLYVSEHRSLLMLARGDLRQGTAELLSSDAASGPRGERLRLAAAATLARKGKKAEALALLSGSAPHIAAARATLERGRKLRGEVVTAQSGVSELLTRMAIDLNGEEVPQLALSFARLAIFLAPENSQARLVAAQLLNLDEKPQAALVVLADIPADDPYAGSAAEARFPLLAAAGRQEEALRLATAATARSGAGQAEWARLADLYMGMKRPAEAAQAYDKAIALPTEALSRPQWALRLQQGDALVQAGQWEAGRAALREAHSLAPSEAMVLNYLGYAQLERRENMDEAERLIREASRLDPENHAITDSLGWALHLRGKHKEAIPLLERAAEGEPADPAIAEHLGDAYYSAGRRFEARHAWSAALVTADAAATTRLRAKIAAGLKPELASP
jgi:tetratricopeptide (TPR) repeat protein